jgi:hypothetical protein
MATEPVTVYPQALPMTKEEMGAFLSQPLIAKLCTHNEDGTIHVVPTWFGYEDGEILVGTQEISRKVRNIKRDNRVTVLVDTTEPRLKGVIWYGEARLDFQDVIPKRVGIFEKYLGSEEAPGLAERLASSWRPVIVRIKPVHAVTFDYSKGFGISTTSDSEPVQLV